MEKLIQNTLIDRVVYFDISFLYFIRNNCIDIVIIDNDYNIKNRS